MDAENGHRIAGYLRDAVAILATPAETQRLWLKKLGTFPQADELALEFDDWAVHIPQLLAAVLIDQFVSDALAELERGLDAVQDAENSWDAESALDSPAWSEVRDAAGRAVVEFLKPHPAGAT